MKTTKSLVVLASAASAFSTHAVGAQDSLIEEVMVTARKKTETLQEVPMAVSVLDGSVLRDNGIDDAGDLYGRIPGLYFTNAGGAAPTSDFIYLVLRGVGFNGGLEPAVGVFIDGMYQPQLGFDIGFLDLERLEVLRGPQGTLFGRNTQGGALNLVTRKPSDEFVGRVEAEVGEFETYRLRASVSGPLADSVFAGLTAEYGESDGYVDNVIPGQPDASTETYAARGTLRWLPTESLELTLSADVSHRGGNEIGVGVPLSCHCYDLAADERGPKDTKDNFGAQLTASWQLSPATALTSITGVRRSESDMTIDLDGRETGQTPALANGRPGSSIAPSPLIVRGLAQHTEVTQDFLSEELRLSGSSERWDWLLGAYYFDQSQDQFFRFDVGPDVAALPAVAFLVPYVILTDFTTDRDGWALFGQSSWRPTPKVEATLGIRFSREDVAMTGERFRNFTQIENDNPQYFVVDEQASFDNVSSTVSLSYALADELRTYVTVAQGWKAGGFSRFPTSANGVLPYDPEKSLNYEVGLKGAWPHLGLTASIALFYIDIEQQQLLTVTPDEAGVPVSTITNAGKSRSQGVELEVLARPDEHWTLSLAAAYTDAQFTDFTQEAPGDITAVRDGDPFEYVPKVTASTTVEYRWPVAANSDLALSATYSYVDNYLVPDGGLLSELGGTLPVPSYDRLDLRVTLNTGSWRVSGYVRNVLDSFDYNNITPDGFFAPTGGYLVYPLEPRTVGVVVSKEF